MKATTTKRTESIMTERLHKNPADVEAIEYFQLQQSKQLINEQYNEMINQYPEGLGRVLMLYIPVMINGTPIQAFCDSGAQSTIMSKTIARQCSIDHLIDTRFAGVAVGVGTGTILGRIHIVQLSFNNNQLILPCSVTVMDDPPIGSQAKSMPFLLGLDMMKRHLCQLDFFNGCIRFYPNGRSSSLVTNGQQQQQQETATSTANIVEVPFLHEKDLSFEQGGTKDFDIQKANEEFLLHSTKDDNNNDDDDDNNTKMDTGK
jgi:Aspartyl protease